MPHDKRGAGGRIVRQRWIALARTGQISWSIPRDAHIAAVHRAVGQNPLSVGEGRSTRVPVVCPDNPPRFVCGIKGHSRDRFAARILGSDTGPSDKLERYREVSPVNYLSKDSPPLLMIQGDQDTTIPVKHAHHMQQEAEATGAPVEIMIIKNAGHNWRRVDADIDPSRDEIIERTVQFFVDHLQQ